MSFLRRLLGGDRPTGSTGSDGEDGATTDAPGDVGPDAEEKAYELDLLRDEQERLSDLARRQLRYADYAWKPPAQGGPERADQEDEEADDADEAD
jgi:hypothetical protein